MIPTSYANPLEGSLIRPTPQEWIYPEAFSYRPPKEDILQGGYQPCFIVVGQRKLIPLTLIPGDRAKDLFVAFHKNKLPQFASTEAEFERVTRKTTDTTAPATTKTTDYSLRPLRFLLVLQSNLQCSHHPQRPVSSSASSSTRSII